MIKIEIPTPLPGEKSIQELHWEWFQKKFKNIRNKQKRDNVLKYVLGIKEDDLEILVVRPFDDPEFITVNNSICEKIKKHISHPNHKRWMKSIEKIFKYDDFINEKNEKKWNSYNFFRKMGINVCPYCNRSYTFTVSEKNLDNTITKVTAPEIDHFFPQDKYPHLACSLYNFIPSCKVCNHVKSNIIESENIIYPYNEEFGKDGTFRVFFSNQSVDSTELINIENVCVRIRKTTKYPTNITELDKVCKKNKRIQKSIERFHLDKVYDEHKIDLKDLFNRYRVYCHPKINEILHLFHEDELKELCDENEKLRENQIDAILGLYAKKMKRMFLGLPLGSGNKQYPLRKFKEDIIEQLDETYRKMKK